MEAQIGDLMEAAPVWTKQKVKEFISIYQNKKLLWDPTDSNYYNRSMKNDAWEDIEKETGVSVDHCKRKMEYLLSALRREKGKMVKSVGAWEVYKSQWFAFESMRFLLGKKNPRPTLSTMECDNATDVSTEDKVENECCAESEKSTPVVVQKPKRLPTNRYKRKSDNDDRLGKAFEENKCCAESEKSTPAVVQKPKPLPINRYKRKSDNDDDRLGKAFQILHTTCNDESVSFGNFVAMKLRTFDEDTRMQLQYDIMGLFLNAKKRINHRPSSRTEHSYSQGILTESDTRASEVEPFASVSHHCETVDYSNIHSGSSFASENSSIISDEI